MLLLKVRAMHRMIRETVSLTFLEWIDGIVGEEFLLC